MVHYLGLKVKYWISNTFLSDANAEEKTRDWAIINSEGSINVCLKFSVQVQADFQIFYSNSEKRLDQHGY